jgi:NAD(P)-dependent dehydrogenase (short-subunit alcohol dehydrogenase family)
MGARFAGKVAIVTGAGRGIGEATALRLAGDGARLVAVDRAADGAEAVAEAIGRAGGQALALTADVADADQVERTVALAVERFGGLHLAVNNAGISSDDAPTADQSLDSWNRTIAVNLTGVFHGLKYQIPAIIAAGGGAIVNVSSVFGGRALPGRSPYTAAKHGVIGLTRAAGLEYARQGVRINALCPGIIDTPLVRAGGDASAGIAAMVPAGRLGLAAEAAAVIAFLLSDDAHYVTAADHAVDGGLLR